MELEKVSIILTMLNGNYQKYPPGINIDPNQEQEEEHEIEQAE